MKTNLRTIVMKRLKATGKTIYWLANHPQGDWSARTIYNWLRDGRDVGTNIAEQVIDILGLDVQARADPIPA